MDGRKAVGVEVREGGLVEEERVHLDAHELVVVEVHLLRLMTMVSANYLSLMTMISANYLSLMTRRSS